MEISSSLQIEIELYCKANNIDDIEKFMLRMLVQGFNIEKYGLKPDIKDKPKYVPLQKPTPVENPTDKTIKEPIDKYKDLYDED